MPKTRSHRELVGRRSRVAPYLPNITQDKEGLAIENHDVSLKKYWEDAKCVFYMDLPHNVVLLLCSSHEKGCHPYMCVTSYMHSNCLD